jgi:sulfur carrier protein ThiS
MAQIVCTPRLENIGPLQPVKYSGDTVNAVLNAAAKDFPRLKNYILDEQGKVRKHIAIFVEGELVPRNNVLKHTVSKNAEIYIMQALSGG